MTKRLILLIEDNPDDQALTLRAFECNTIANELIILETPPDTRPE